MGEGGREEGGREGGRGEGGYELSENVYGKIKGQNANLLVYIGFAMTHSLYIRPIDGLYRDGTAHVSGV